MADSVSPYAQRPAFVAGNIGLDSSVGVRAGYAPIPQLQLEAHVGSILLWQTYGADVRYQPLAGAFSVTPTLRVGASALQNNLAGFGGNPWFPVVSAAAGVAWRTHGGFMLQGDVGAMGAIHPTGASWLPTFSLSVGYAF